MKGTAFERGQDRHIAAHLAAAHLLSQGDLPAVWSAEVCTLNPTRKADLTIHLFAEDTLTSIRQWAEFLGAQVQTEEWTADAMRAFVDATHMGVPVRVWTILREAPRATVIQGEISRDLTQDQAAARAAAEVLTPPPAEPAALAPDGITRAFSAWPPPPTIPPLPTTGQILDEIESIGRRELWSQQ